MIALNIGSEAYYKYQAAMLISDAIVI